MPQKKRNIKKKKFFQNKLYVFMLGFILGILPILIGYLYFDPIMSVWSIFTGLIVGILALAINWLWSKNKIAGIVSLIILGLLYIWSVVGFLSVSIGGLY